MKELIDTHCHIHEADARLAGEDPVRALWLRGGKHDPSAIIQDAKAAGVTGMICVGTHLEDSKLAVEFGQKYEETYASIGLHPHEAARYVGNERELVEFRSLATKPKVVAVGETGLDYYYLHSPKQDQQKLLRFQIELALEHELPLIFHVREAFADFWPILDDYGPVRGVVHSFSTNRQVLDQALSRGLYIGLNGIMTFTKHAEQLAAAKAVPVDKLVVETDAPFLTPAPFRGTICEPKHVLVTAQFLAELRGESPEDFAAATTRNAKELFKLS